MVRTAADVRVHYQALAGQGWTVYAAGTEWPALTEDEFVAAAEAGRRVDMCRERPGGEIVCYSGVVIRF